MNDETKRCIRALFLSACEQNHAQEWEPSADIYQTQTGWVVKFDLAGVRPEDLRVMVKNDCLTVEGVRKDLFAEKGAKYYSMEISYFRFRRCLRLPVDLSDVHVHWEYRDGMLLVWMNETGTGIHR